MPHKEKTLAYYKEKLTTFRRDNKNGGAPHKPILLLSIISNIETKIINDNKIFLSPELVGSFKKIWSDLVENEKKHCIITLPFFHFTSSPFWRLIPKIGFEQVIKSKIAMKSFSNLHSAVEYAEIDIELFNFLKEKEKREFLKKTILDKFFSETKNNYSNDNNNYIQNIENDILNETSSIYKTKLLSLKDSLKNDEFEEEKHLRSNIFKRQIPVLYQNTCAISGLQINATVNVSLIDACHIVPFSNSYDDTVTNGISLTPTLHRAFDRGLISIDDNYRILVSGKFIENRETNYSIKQFENKEIILPDNSIFYPNLENLKWHRENILQK